MLTPWEDDPWTDPDVTTRWDETVAAWRRNRGLCGICGEFVSLKVESGPRKATVDHILPTSKGGGDNWENLQIAHRGCNSWKGNRNIGGGEPPAPPRVVMVDLADLLEPIRRKS